MRRLLLTSTAIVLLAGGLAAQARSDQARLSFGMAIGYNGGSNLWSVHDQTIFGSFGVDSADVSRIIRPTLGITFLGVYYPNSRIGFTGEIHLIGLAYEDHCSLTTNSGSADTHQICSSINGSQSPGTAVAATVGTILRPFPWAGVQPYFRGNVGLTVSEQSTLRMRANFIEEACDTTQSTCGSTYFLFEDSHPTSVSPTGALAVGITGFVGRGSQLRVEVKDNLVILKEVRGTTAYQAREPPWQQKVHQIFTLSVGMEVVLEKRRGRRY